MNRVVLLLAITLVPTTTRGPDPAAFRSVWPADLQRIWIGPEYWSNPLQDWRIAGGRLECTVAAPNRSVHLLTRDLAPRRGDLLLSVRLAPPPQPPGTPGVPTTAGRAWAGFRIGARGRFKDYRDSAVRGIGLDAGVTSQGALFLGTVPDAPPAEGTKIEGGIPSTGIELRLDARPSEDAVPAMSVSFSACDPVTGRTLASLPATLVDESDLVGNLALVSSVDRGGETPAPSGVPPAGAWFRDWRVSGSKVACHDDRRFGPILFSMYTLSRGTLEMTAQMPPLGLSDGSTVDLEIRDSEGAWKRIASARIDPLARTATLRVEGWDATRDIPYRLVHELASPSEPGGRERHTRTGTIRRDPRDREAFILAAFTGNNDLGFPHADVAAHVAAHDPDLLFFSGDQIYEGVGGFGHTRSPLEVAALDYLRKWFLFGWAFGDLMRDRPTIAIPDDHDVYHGNLWGAAGKAVERGGSGADEQDSGGYRMPPAWVRMVERTQTSHLPDPADPRPVQQGIGVYFCEVNYGGVSFAVLEDRKFKSAPKPLLPEAKVWNGWAQNPEWDAKTRADVPGAVLLGERQLAFLRHWAEDWSGGAWMKIALSQTLFANIATLPAEASSGARIPNLPIPAPGVYPAGQKLAADMDSNGWPPSGRNRALAEIRRALALHVAGDQHLGSTVRYGIDEWGDAGYALCVPSISNFWPRRWYPPPEVGRNRAEGAPLYTGDFEDGFGNKMTVLAVANPTRSGIEPTEIHDRASGYGIVRLHRTTREIEIECWPRAVDPSDPDARPFPGWPILVHQVDQYARTPWGRLPTIEVQGISDPVVQVFDEESDELVYVLRIRGSTFSPRVFAPGRYRVRVGDPDLGRQGTWKTFDGLEAVPGSVMPSTLRAQF